MKAITLLFICLFFFGCADEWVPQKKVETPEERKCVISHETEILSHCPKSLNGHDQDWDDAIEAAHKIAIDACCQTRTYEFKKGFDGGYTGRMRDISK